jgi:transposase
MNKKLIYVGLDVDDTQYHGAAFDKETGEIVSFKCRPTLKGLISQLEKIQKYFSVESLKLCYEASYIGHCLQRDLMQAGSNCDVISPGSIPRKGSKAIKTDRIDVLDLARFYANDLLTIVQIPDEETEQDRDLLRSRQQLMKQQNDLRCHIQFPDGRARESNLVSSLCG